MKEQRKNERFLFTRVTMSSFNIYKNHWYAWRKHIKLRGHGKFLRGVCVDDKVMYLTSYVRQCRESGRSPIVCKAVLAAIAFFWKARGVDASVFLDERMKLLRRALAEGTTASMGRRVKLARLGVTYDMVARMRERLCNGSVDDKMTYIFSGLAFHFMLRLSNLIKTKAGHSISGDDIEFIEEGSNGVLTRWSYQALRLRGWNHKITCANLVVRSSKTKSKLRPHYLRLGRATVQEAQLLDDLLAWGKASQSKVGEPLLSRWKYGKYKALTTKMASTALKACAVEFKLDPVYFTLHSYRIGGATANKSAGVSRKEYKDVADWSEKSDNDLLYTHTVRGSGTLAHVGRAGMTTARDVALLIPPPGRPLAAAVGVRQVRGKQSAGSKGQKKK